jgi:hypothetical protein
MVNRVNIGAKGTKLDYDNWGVPVTNAVNDHDTQLLQINGPWVAASNILWCSSGTQPSLGNGILTGHYNRFGTNRLIFTFQLTMGSTTTFGTGTWFIRVPITPTADAVNECIGTLWILDAGTLDKAGVMKFENTTDLTLVATSGGVVTPTNPQTWAVNDKIRGSMIYAI